MTMFDPRMHERSVHDLAAEIRGLVDEMRLILEDCTIDQSHRKEIDETLHGINDAAISLQEKTL